MDWPACYIPWYQCNPPLATAECFHWSGRSCDKGLECTKPWHWLLCPRCQNALRKCDCGFKKEERFTEVFVG